MLYNGNAALLLGLMVSLDMAQRVLRCVMFTLPSLSADTKRIRAEISGARRVWLICSSVRRGCTQLVV